MTVDPLAMDKLPGNILQRQQDTDGRASEGARFWLTEVAADERYALRRGPGQIFIDGGVDTVVPVLRLRVDPSADGELNGIVMYSEGEVIMERDELNSGANGTPLGLRRRNQNPAANRTVLRLATKTAGGAAPQVTFGGNLTWQGTTHSGGDNDAEMGTLGFHWANVASGNMKSQFAMWLLGDSANIYRVFKANNDVIAFDDTGIGGVPVLIGHSSQVAGTKLHTVGGNVIFDAEDTWVIGGLRVGTPGGGNMGEGSINVADEIYRNGDAYDNPDFVLEHYYHGRIDRFADNDGAADYRGLLPLAQLSDYLRNHLHLPGRDSEPTGIFERADLVQRWIEELAIYITQLHGRLEALETA